MNVLVTAGPTREYFDTVRFISNPSTGKMGYAIAEASRDAGCNVTLISGPVALTPPDGVTFISVETSKEMLDACVQHFESCDVAVMTAAVCDYRPADRLDRKLKKSGAIREVVLEPTTDICAHLGSIKGDRRVIGFAMEDHDHKRFATEKLTKKNCDAIVLNGISNVAADAGSIEILLADGSWLGPYEGTKAELARVVVENVLNKNVFKVTGAIPKRTRTIVGICGLLVILCAGLAMSIGGRHTAFIERLEEEPLLFCNELACSGLSAANAELVALEAKDLGVDTLNLYINNVESQELKLQFAYLLLLQSNWDYLAHVDTNFRTIDEREFLVWTFLLGSPGKGKGWRSNYIEKRIAAGGRSDPYLDKMLNILDTIGGSPAGLAAVASYAIYDNDLYSAMEILLDLPSYGHIWGAEAYELVMTIPEEKRVPLLEKRLETISLAGVYAAYYLLTENDSHRDALQFLQRAQSSDDTMAKGASEIILGWLE